MDDAEARGDADSDAVLDADADADADDVLDADAVDDADVLEVALVDADVDADSDADADADAVDSTRLMDEGISQSLSRMAPPAGQFMPAKPVNGGMMSPQPLSG